jgi:hypothetical protein
MYEKKLRSFSKNENKRQLLKHFNQKHNTNYKSITPVRRFYLNADANEVYYTLMNEYNAEVDRLNSDVRFYADVTIRRTYKKDYIENGVVKYPSGYTFEYVERTLPLKMKRKDIDGYIHDKYDKEDSLYIDVVISYTLTEFNPKDFNKYKREQKKIMMKDAIVLKREWLSFSENIAEKAYEETDGKCVYNQLVDYLINPPSGRPTKFVNGKKVSEEGLFQYFNSIVNDDDYPDFNIHSGVSTEMLERLANEIGRSLYAFDRNSKLFSSVVIPNKKYSPIVYYQIDGHMFLINDPSVFNSISKSALNEKKLVSNIILDRHEEEKKNQKTELPVIHTGWEIDYAKEYDSGIYLLQKSNVFDEFMSYMNKYMSEPKTRSLNGQIVSFNYSYQRNKQKFIVYVACDVNYKDKINYNQIKNVAEQNGIKYVNEGMGSVVLELEKRLLIEKAKEIVEEEVDEELLVEDEDSDDDDDETVSSRKEKKNKINAIIQKEYSSSFNTIVQEHLINSYQFKSYQFIEIVQENTKKEIIEEEYIYEDVLPSPNNILSYFGVEKITTKKINKMKKIVDETSFKIDGVKFRRNIMYNNKYEYPVYSVMDIPRAFSGEIRCGLYYVNTEATIPFRGSGWYLQPTVEYGLKNGLIKLEEIELEFIPSKTIPCNYFQEYIDYLLKAFSVEPDLQKRAINAFIGLLGRTKRVYTTNEFKKCPYEASEFVDKENVFIDNHKLDNGEIIYEIITTQEATQDYTDYLIYKMILEQEAIELHILENKIKSKGGIPLDRNTDAIRYTAKNKIILDDKWDNGINKYQEEEPSVLQIPHLPNMVRKPIEDLSSKFSFNWKIMIDDMTDLESMKQKAKEIIDKDISLNVDGMGGTAKTTMVNFIKEELNVRGNKFALFSPTNKGALLIEGQTIHKLFNKFSTSKNMMVKSMRSLKYIFVDEVSMMIEKFYKLFIMIKSLCPHIRFIISGDYGQLPPVKDEWKNGKGNYKSSAGLYDLCDGNKFHLTKCRRADEELFNISKTLDVSSIINKKNKLTYLNIAYKHKTRKMVNEECMNRFIKEKKSQTITIPVNPLNQNTQEIKLAVGMPLVCYKTDKKLDVMNSEFYNVKEIQEKEIIITNKRGDKKVPIKFFNRNFYLGFCITIYASQGETFTEPYTIFDWNFKYMCNKAKYVALSRSTSKKLIQIN